MNQTASKLVASVQRVKEQPGSAHETPSGQQALDSVPSQAVVPEVASSVSPRRRPSVARAQTANTEKASQGVAVHTDAQGNHNGNQPVFPQRVWPD